MKTRLTLIGIILASLCIGIVSAQTDYEAGTVFLSDVGGGNITFVSNITATTFSNAVGNQARFTQMSMLGNGTWSRIGFRNDNANNTIEIVGLGARWVNITCIIENNTAIEIYTPDRGRPTDITGGIGSVWNGNTLTVTMNADDSIILSWPPGGPEAQDSLYNSLIALIVLLPLLAILFFFGASVVDLRRNPVFILLIAIAIFGAIVWIAANTGWI